MFRPFRYCAVLRRIAPLCSKKSSASPFVARSLRSSISFGSMPTKRQSHRYCSRAKGRSVVRLPASSGHGIARDQNFLAPARKPAQRSMVRLPQNMTPFAPFDGLPPLHKVDQTMMRRLRELAHRRGWSVEHLMHEALEQWVAQCQVERELEAKIIRFPVVNSRSR